jgi:hypothetical protein
LLPGHLTKNNFFRRKIVNRTISDLLLATGLVNLVPIRGRFPMACLAVISPLGFSDFLG